MWASSQRSSVIFIFCMACSFREKTYWRGPMACGIVDRRWIRSFFYAKILTKPQLRCKSWISAGLRGFRKNNFTEVTRCVLKLLWNVQNANSVITTWPKIRRTIRTEWKQRNIVDFARNTRYTRRLSSPCDVSERMCVTWAKQKRLRNLASLKV